MSGPFTRCDLVVKHISGQKKWQSWFPWKKKKNIFMEVWGPEHLIRMPQTRGISLPDAEKTCGPMDKEVETGIVRIRKIGSWALWEGHDVGHLLACSWGGPERAGMWMPFARSTPSLGVPSPFIKVDLHSQCLCPLHGPQPLHTKQTGEYVCLAYDFPDETRS